MTIKPKHEKVVAIPPHIAAFQLAGYSAWNGEDAGSSPACYTNPTPISLVGFSLFGKASHCGCEESGSIPGVNQEGL
jgi:hypothetical protein